MTSTPAATTYLVEFGPAWPVPPITVDFTDRGAAINAVTEHAIPHLKPILTEKGRPELADCFFRTDPGLTEGSFMWINLAEGMSALFCPARLTPVDPAAPDPLAYGPTGYRCGCGKDAHSNLVPCQPDRPRSA
ncbi:hypothetical protein [Streptomyces sp. LUP30]|uniref:hypothetical protein n=1 Tax=Streptomyces sp. LUP30 TaxID=1890285 RepID=UPI0008516E56|nr:hypothetical protein [Streptomyces sp. LUP30]